VLAVGVSGVRGDFRANDSVRVLAPDGEELGRGLARCSSVEAVVIAGKKEKKGDLEDQAIMIHRDDLVVW
jgi:glutamate 5-kinase